MLYRIAIYRNENGKRVFDHYADEEYSSLLKVSNQGKVLKMATRIHDRPPQKSVIDWEFIDSGAYSILDWEDVSDTHEVEWGCNLTSDPIYENDIILIHDGDGICYEVRDGVFPLMEFYTNYLVNGSPYCEIEVIGNIHEEVK